jgi:hypothetical protein
VPGLEDFDRYCEEHNFQPGEYGAAFAQRLANVSGETIIGGPADEPPEFVVVPDASMGRD